MSSNNNNNNNNNIILTVLSYVIPVFVIGVFVLLFILHFKDNFENKNVVTVGCAQYSRPLYDSPCIKKNNVKNFKKYAERKCNTSSLKSHTCFLHESGDESWTPEMSEICGDDYYCEYISQPNNDDTHRNNVLKPLQNFYAHANLYKDKLWPLDF